MRWWPCYTPAWFPAEPVAANWKVKQGAGDQKLSSLAKLSYRGFGAGDVPCSGVDLARPAVWPVATA